jgi:xanthine dehydrogenase YagS FAD-binding subunit
MNNFTYLRATSVSGAIAQVAQNPTAQWIAGGTNLVDRLKVFLDQPSQLVDISRLPLQQIQPRPDGSLQIGALATNTALADHPLVRRNYPLLARAILSGASQQIRNVATVGGNLMQRTRCPYFYDTAFACNKRQPGSGCPAAAGANRTHAILGASDQCVATHPSDMCVALAALDAQVMIEGPGGKKRTVAIADFHRLPGTTPQQDTVLTAGELITQVVLSPAPSNRRGVYLKVRDRASYAFALVSVAAVLDLQGDRIQSARLALGGVAHRPWRAQAAEAFLQNKPATAETFAAAAELALREAKPLADNGFKVELTKRAMRRALAIAGGVA